MTAQQLQPLIDDLRAEMEDVYADDMKLHRAWLELDWLETAMMAGDLSLPSTWESAIHQAISNHAFADYPAAELAAKRLYDVLRKHIEWNFTFKDLSDCTNALRAIGTGADDMETVADRVVSYLYEKLLHQATGERVCSLVRLFKTHAYGDLQSEQQLQVRQTLGFEPEDRTRCLTLLSTRGVQPEWNSRHASVAHKAIPLTSADMIRRSPMISRLLDELGVDIAPLIKHDEKIVLDRGKSEYGVFYVEDAIGSKHIPAQEEFVKKNGIRSVVGFAGELPSGALFVVILFFNVKVKLKAASLFKTVALSTELGLVPFDGKQIFRRSSEEVG